MKIKIKKLHENAVLPEKGSEGAACYDIGAVRASINGVKKIVTFHTGIAIQVPKGYELNILPRSHFYGLYGLKLTNQTGVVDSDYRGEILIKMDYREPICKRVDFDPNGIICYNSRGIPAKILWHHKIAQIKIIRQGLKCEWDVVDELDNTKRGKGGFGSTGK